MATDPHDTHTAAIATPGAGASMRMVEIALIAESPHNPRKTFDPAKLQELADSIAATGVHQPILLRPLPAHRVADTFANRAKNAPLPAFELVAGARRLRACKLAKVLEVPAMIRELTDNQALEVAIIENLQREDVSELEEAEGYEALMQQSQLTADAVGAKIGKSRSYVYARLKLLDLCQEARRSLREGGIDASKALLLARIPDHALQIKALERIEADDHHTPSYREASQAIQREFMLRLENAKFDRENPHLVAMAGPCSQCPKRTGHAPELFADVNSADLCTDPPCYRAKEEAHSTNLKRDAQARGQTIIDGREAKALMPNDWTNRVEGYLRLDNAADSPTDKPLRALIGKAMEQQGVQPTLIANPHKDGELIAVLLPAQVNELLKAQGHADAAEKMETEAAQDAKGAAKAAKAKAELEYEKAWRWELLETTWKRVQDSFDDVPPAVLRHVVRGKARSLNTERAKRLCKLLGLGNIAPVAGIEQWAADEATDPAAAMQLLVMEADVEHQPWLESVTETNVGLFLVAKQAGIDLEAIKAQTKANQRADAALAAKAADKKRAQAQKANQADAPESISTPPPAAQAGGVRGEAKQKGTRPAARAATEQPHTSKEHASAQIASALQALEDQAVAPAAQSNEAPPVATAQATPGNGGEVGMGAGKGAAMSTGKAKSSTAQGAIQPGQVLQVKETCANVKWRGRKVTVLTVGATIKVRVANTPSNTSERGSFFEEDLCEVVA